LGRQTIWPAGRAAYRGSTNPKIATADGHAMAWRRGDAQDMEMVQFHPPRHVAGSSRALITEAVRGEERA
jgi:L-aspartate oxidase